jgi:hypothetical protein
MASWKKVIVSGSNANLSNLQVDSLSSGVVTGASGNLTTTAINGSGNIVATSGATGLSVSGSFSGSFFGLADSASVAARATELSPLATASFADSATTASHALTLSQLATASFALSADSASVAARATTLSPEATASIADFATTASYALTGDGVFSGSFSGSFVGDGSGLTGLATVLTIDGDTGGTSTVDLLTQTLDIEGTSNEIETSVSGQTITIGLPDDVTISQDLTVTRDATITRNLTVLGTASFQNTTDLDVADRFIRLASGSNASGDGGIVIQQDSDTNGEAFAFDSATSRWGVTGSFDAATNTITPDAFMATVVEGVADDPTAAPARYTKKGNTFVANNGDIYIYS